MTKNVPKTSELSDDIVVKVDHVAKTFRLPKEHSSELKQEFINRMRGIKGYTDLHVLRDVSFEVHEGDFFGIVGRNGSGKSTLLKLLAGIYQPTKGTIETKGKIVPFIELGVGFNPELTGRENVYMNGAMLGFSNEEVGKMYHDIVEFAELEKFMDQKLKNYSSGMQVRLAFSIAIKAQGDILILDEVLAVGDEAFQRKCTDYFFDAKKQGKTIILVTHSMDSVRQFCNRAMLIVDGEVAKIGNPDQIASEYSKIFIDEHAKELAQKADEDKAPEKTLSDVELRKIEVLQEGREAKTVNFRQNFSIDIALDAKKPHKDLTLGLHVIDQAGRAIVALATKNYGKFDLKKGENHIVFDMQNILTDGDYYFNISIEEGSINKLILQQGNVGRFTVLGVALSKYSKYGLTHPDYEVKINEK